MATWKEFETAAPDLARDVRARFTATKHHVLASLRRDGSPRVSGTEVDFAGAELRLGSMAGAVKGRDLKRDGRFALHANPGDGSMAGGDAKIAGTAVAAAPEPGAEGGADCFVLDITEVVHTAVAGDELLIRSWRPGDGEREVRRR